MPLTAKQEQEALDAIAQRRKEYQANKANPPKARLPQALKCNDCGAFAGQPGVTVAFRANREPYHKNCPKGKRGVL